jgi:predicted DNA-binding protein
MISKEKTEKKLTGVRLDPELIRDLKYLALDLDRTVTSLIEEGAKTMLQKYKVKK